MKIWKFLWTSKKAIEVFSSNATIVNVPNIPSDKKFIISSKLRLSTDLLRKGPYNKLVFYVSSDQDESHLGPLVFHFPWRACAVQHNCAALRGEESSVSTIHPQKLALQCIQHLPWAVMIQYLKKWAWAVNYFSWDAQKNLQLLSLKNLLA